MPQADGDRPPLRRPHPVRRGAAGPDVLLIEKSAHLRSHAGQPAFPGGGVDPGDDFPVGTALREAEEEAGIDPAGVRVLATLPELFLGAVGPPRRPGGRLVGRPAGRDRRRSARGGAGRPGAAGRAGRPGQPLPAAAPRRASSARRSASPTWRSGASPRACWTPILEAAGLARPWDDRRRPAAAGQSAIRPYTLPGSGGRRRRRPRRADGGRPRAGRPGPTRTVPPAMTPGAPARRDAGRPRGGPGRPLVRCSPSAALAGCGDEEPTLPAATRPTVADVGTVTTAAGRRPGGHPADRGRLRLHPRPLHRGARGRCG